MSNSKTTPDNLSVDEALDHAPSRQPIEGYWKMAINTFIVSFLFCVGTWFLNESPVKTKITTYTWQALVAFGWYQHWGLFSPDVRHKIYHETAVIRFKDGSMKIYEYPRAQKMNHWTRFKHEKLRKMFGDNMPWSMGEPFLPAFAQHLADSNSNSKNPPKSITFIMNWVDNPPPNGPDFVMRDNLPKHIYKYITFKYSVPDDTSATDSEKGRN